MLIDLSYFKGDIKLTISEKKDFKQVGIGSMLQSIGENNIEDYIQKFEAEYLTKLLGKMLYENFMDGLNAASPLQIWIDLKEALTRESTSKISPIAYYVYCPLMDGGSTSTTTKGEKQAVADYTISVSTSAKVVNAWYWMTKYSMEFYEWLSENWEYYKDYSRYGYLRIHDFGLRNVFNI